uniref:Uncharacterized protein n=1 Tax=Sulfolobus tengchongensis TaxID=207809 RepID=Q6H0Z5_9CREN|nr:hypothetical protein [Sulfolobus tengchongensis]AAT46501.1 hypothetical protein [Sulfolobus tengchongensis]
MVTIENGVIKISGKEYPIGYLIPEVLKAITQSATVRVLSHIPVGNETFLVQYIMYWYFDVNVFPYAAEKCLIKFKDSEVEITFKFGEEKLTAFVRYEDVLEGIVHSMG